MSNETTLGIIAMTTVESKPGATIRVERVTLSTYGSTLLQAGDVEITPDEPSFVVDAKVEVQDQTK